MSAQANNLTFTVTFGIIENPVGSGRFHLTCEPAVLHVAPGDYIKFHAGGLPFSVVAKGKSPIRDLYIQSEGKPVTSRVLDVGCACSLACAVFDKNKIYIDANCPAINPDGGIQG